MYRQTKNLIIRDVSLEDVDECFAYRSHPDVTLWMPFDDQSHDDTLTWIEDEMQVNFAVPRTSHSCSIVLKEIQQVIGWVGVDLSPEDKQKYGDYQLTYCLHPDYWGQGYATEAVVTVLHYCFTEWNAESLFADCNALNPLSFKVVEEAGMKKYRYFRDGEHTIVTYSVDKDDWDTKRFRKYRT